MSHPNIRFLDRAKETTTTTGSGTIGLAGAVAGFVGISGIGNGNSTYYTLQEGNNFEVGIGTYATSGNTLSRDEVFSSSNSDDSKIDLAGSTTVFITYAADKAVTQTSGNYVGIGIDPEYQLQVSGTGSFNTVRWADGTSQTTAATDYTAGTGLTLVGTEFNTAGTGYFDSLGIGTASPDYLLDVAGNAGFDEYIYHNGDDNTYIQFGTDQIDFVVGAANMIYLNEGGGGDQEDKVTINNDLADVDFQAKGATDANLIRTDAANDKVGIGTSAPEHKLHVSGDIGVNEYINHNGDGDTYLRLRDNNINLVAGGKSAIILNYSTGKIQLNNSNADLDVQIMADDGEVILHTDAGKNQVGIGTDSPDAMVDVVCANATDIGLKIEMTAIHSGNPLEIVHSDGTPRFSIDTAGDISCGAFSGSGTNFILGKENISATLRVADLANNLNIRNTNADKNIHIDVAGGHLVPGGPGPGHSGGCIRFREYPVGNSPRDGVPYGTFLEFAFTSGIGTGMYIRSRDDGAILTQWLNFTGLPVAMVDATGAISGQHFIFGDGTTQTTASAGGSSYTAGTGLSLAGTVFNVSGIDSTMIVDGTVSNTDLTNSSITITAGTGLSNAGAVSLGGTVTLDADAGTTLVSGIVRLQDSATDGTTDRAITPNAVYDIQTTLQTSINTNTTNIASTGATNAADIVTVSGLLSSPGGSDTQIQFNDGGSFAGDSDLIWNNTENLLTVNGTGAFDKLGVNDATPDAMVDIVCSSFSTKGLIVQGAVSQSENLIEAQLWNGATRFVVDEVGRVECNAITSTGTNLILGDIAVSPIIKVADGGNHLNIRNLNADKDINLDIAESGNFVQIRTKDGVTTTTRVQWEDNGKRHDQAASYADIKSNADATTVTFDLDVANVHQVTLGADRTFALSNASSGQRFMVRVEQNGTGGHSGLWWSTIKWAGGTPPVQPDGTSNANEAALYGFLCVGTNTYDGFVIGTGIA